MTSAAAGLARRDAHEVLRLQAQHEGVVEIEVESTPVLDHMVELDVPAGLGSVRLADDHAVAACGQAQVRHQGPPSSSDPTSVAALVSAQVDRLTTPPTCAGTELPTMAAQAGRGYGITRNQPISFLMTAWSDQGRHMGGLS